MSTLRGRLLRTTWIAVLLVGALSAAVTFLAARRETEVMLDGQLQRVALLAASIQVGAGGAEAVRVTPPSGYEAEDDLVVAIRGTDGALLFASHPQIALPAQTAPGFADVKVGAATYRTYTLPLATRRVVVAQATAVRRESAVDAARGALLLVVLIIPVLGLVITWAVRRQLRDVTRVAQSLADRPPLSLEPLPADALPAEVQPLVAEFNELLERVRATLAREKSFIADAAHALRTPLTALQLQAQVLDGSPDPAERARRLAELESGIRRIVRLSAQLLDLARADGAAGSAGESCALPQIVSELQGLFGPLAARLGVTLEWQCPAGLAARGSATQLLLVFSNLLDNALRYAPPGSRVALRVRPEGARLTVQVDDEGPGIPAASLTRVFERFYRVPGDATPGNGLGLATVRAAVEQLGGTVTLANRTDRSGLRVTLELLRHD